MKKTMWFIKYFLLILAIISISEKAVNAQRADQPDGSTQLLDNKCIPSVEYTGHSNGAFSHFITDSRENISLGKQLFIPEFYFYAIGYQYDPSKILLTCELGKSKNFETLRLSFGIEDYATDEEHEAIVSFYLDGNKVSSYKISAGVGRTTILDAANINNIAIEVECSYSENNQFRCPNINFVEAKLFSK